MLLVCLLTSLTSPSTSSSIPLTSGNSLGGCSELSGFIGGTYGFEEYVDEMESYPFLGMDTDGCDANASASGSLALIITALLFTSSKRAISSSTFFCSD